ncbi:MAG: hypothetical protein GX279_06945 [Clostridiaceae bacterium]|nr:hypothetical protein [Clostridiaceae bacterium]
MKRLGMIYRWILISVILQTTILAYINFVYLPNRGQFRTTMYETEVPSVKNRSFSLPKGAENVRVSFDGLFASYRLGDKLEIADLDRRKVIKRLEAGEGEFSYHRWLPDREMLIYSIKEPDGKSGRVRISTYDIVPELDRSYPDIKNLPEGSEVVGIELSPLTNIVYPKIKTSSTRARIYRFDIMDDLKLIFKTDLTTIIKETMYTDHLIYQPEGKKISIRNGKTGKTTYVPVKEALLLLAVDDNDFIYAGAGDKSGRITEIYYGKAGQKANEWQPLKPERPAAMEDIYITAAGAVYTADKTDNRVKCLKSSNGGAGGEIEFEGRLLTVLDNYVVSIDGSRLIMKVIKK